MPKKATAQTAATTTIPATAVAPVQTVPAAPAPAAPPAQADFKLAPTSPDQDATEKDWITHPIGVLVSGKLKEQFKTKEEAGAWLDENFTAKQQVKAVIVSALRRKTTWE